MQKKALNFFLHLIYYGTLRKMRENVKDSIENKRKFTYYGN